MFKFLISFIFIIFVGCASKPTPPAPTPPEKPDDPTPATFRLCLIGDTGTASEDQYMVAKAMGKEACDKVLIAGDIIYSTGLKNKDDNDFYKKFYNPYKELIVEQGVQFILAAGNHDWYKPGHPKAWIEVAKDKDWLVYPNYYYSLQWTNGVCVFVFDTEYYKDSQAKWFFEVKDKYKSCKASIALGHKPYLSSGNHGHATGKNKKLMENVILGHFDVFVAGHDHHLEDLGKIEDTLLLVSGAGAKLRTVKEDEVNVWAKAVLGYVVMDIVGNKISYRFVGVKDDKRTTLHQDSFEGKGLR